MKREILLSVLLCLATLSVLAQDARRFTINGHLTDIDSKEPMEHVSVQLFTAADSAFVGGTVSTMNAMWEQPAEATHAITASTLMRCSMCATASICLEARWTPRAATIRNGAIVIGDADKNKT